MHKLAVMLILVMSLWISPAWALFESTDDLSASARLTLDEAVRIAVTAIPGRAVEAQIEKEDGKIVYEVEIIDTSSKTRTVYVDALNGTLLKVDK